MSATCDKCNSSATDSPRPFSVTLCPLHAQADTAIDLLRRLVADVDDWWEGDNEDGPDHLYRRFLEEARPLLAAIDGAPAESEA